MATVKRFEDLDVWKLSRDLCNRVGELIDNEVFKRNYRLIGQLEGSSGSIIDNIAEGFERGSKSEFILFLGYSKGSCGELRSQFYRAFDRKYLSEKQFEDLTLIAIGVSAMLQKFIVYLQNTTIKGLRKKESLNN